MSVLDDFPPDIIEAATRVGHDMGMPPRQFSVAVCKALLAERERCAVIAAGFHKINPQAKFIAEAIRKGE